MQKMMKTIKDNNILPQLSSEIGSGIKTMIVSIGNGYERDKDFVWNLY